MEKEIKEDWKQKEKLKSMKKRVTGAILGFPSINTPHFNLSGSTTFRTSCQTIVSLPMFVIIALIFIKYMLPLLQQNPIDSKIETTQINYPFIIPPMNKTIVFALFERLYKAIK